MSKVQSHPSKLKVISIASLDTASTVQLRSIHLHMFTADITESTSEMSSIDIIEHIKHSTEYQHQLLLTTPTMNTLYCFDGQSKFVCMFQDLNSCCHEIVITKEIREKYNVSNTIITFEDKKKVLYQLYVEDLLYL